MSVENIKKFSNKLGQTMNFIVNETVSIIETDEFKNKVTEYNKEMLSAGYGYEGKLGEYTPRSKELRAEKGLPTEFVDLKQTGEFQESIFVQSSKVSATEPAVIIDASDYKWRSPVSGFKDNKKSLQERYPDALGINEKDLPEFGGYIATPLAQRLSKFWKI